MVEKIKKAKQKLRSPSAFTILFVVIIVMAALTWVVPSGLYKTNEDGDRIANSYHVVDKERTVTEEKDGKKEEVKKHDQQGLWDVFTAPIKGMSDKLDVIVFVMVLGGFLGVTMKTGALDASLGALLRKMKGQGKVAHPDSDDFIRYRWYYLRYARRNCGVLRTSYTNDDCCWL